MGTPKRTGKDIENLYDLYKTGERTVASGAKTTMFSGDIGAGGTSRYLGGSTVDRHDARGFGLVQIPEADLRAAQAEWDSGLRYTGAMAAADTRQNKLVDQYEELVATDPAKASAFLVSQRKRNPGWTPDRPVPRAPALAKLQQQVGDKLATPEGAYPFLSALNEALGHERGLSGGRTMATKKSAMLQTYDLNPEGVMTWYPGRGPLDDVLDRVLPQIDREFASDALAALKDPRNVEMANRLAKYADVQTPADRGLPMTMAYPGLSTGPLKGSFAQTTAAREAEGARLGGFMPQVSVSATPGAAGGGPQGLSFDQKLDLHRGFFAHPDVVDPATGRMPALDDLGIRHEVITPEKISSFQQTAEPSALLRVYGNQNTARFVGSLLGEALRQDGAGVITPDPRVFNIGGLRLKHPEGRPFTLDEQRAIAQGGPNALDVEVHPDGHVLFVDYDRADKTPEQVEEWGRKVLENVEAAGYNRSQVDAYKGASEYVGSGDYGRHLEAARDLYGTGRRSDLQGWRDRLAGAYAQEFERATGRPLGPAPGPAAGGASPGAVGAAAGRGFAPFPRLSCREALTQGAAALGGAAAAQYGTDEDTSLGERAARAVFGAEAGLRLAGAGPRITRLWGAVAKAPPLEAGARLDAANQRIVDRVTGAAAAARKADPTELAARIDSRFNRFVRAWTDRQVDLNQFAQEAEAIARRELGRGLQPEEMAHLLARVNPDARADRVVENVYEPIIRSVGDDLPYLDTYLEHWDNIDKAAAVGGRVTRERTARILPERAPPSQGQLDEAKARLADLQTVTTAKTRLGAATREVAKWERRVARERGAEARRLVEQRAAARGAGEEAAASRLFSGGIDVEASHAGLENLEQSLGPERFGRIEEAGGKIHDLIGDYVDRKVRAGIFSQELGDYLRTTFPHYIPTKILDYLAARERQGGNFGTKIGLRDRGLRELTVGGTASERENATTSVLRLIYDSERQIAKNDTFNAFAKLAEIAKNEGVARDVVPVKTRAGEQVYEDIAGIGAGDARRKDWTVVRGYKDGEQRALAVRSDVAPVVQMEAGYAAPPVVQSGMVALKSALTSRNPLWVAKNLMGDAASYVVRQSTREGGPQQIPNVLRELFSSYAEEFSALARGQQSESARAFAGGGFGRTAPRTPEEYGAAVQRMAGNRGRPWEIGSASDA